MKKLLLLLPLALAALFLLVPDYADGRGWRGGGRGGGGGGGGAETDTGSSGGDSSSGGSSGGAASDGGGSTTDSGSSSSGSQRTAPSASSSGGPSDGLGDNRGEDAPKDPANALRDELKFHCEQARRQCAGQRGWDLLWRAYNGGRDEVTGRVGLCAVPEQPGEDEPVADDQPAGSDAPAEKAAGSDAPAEKDAGAESDE
jgi:hypothetical protein